MNAKLIPLLLFLASPALAGMQTVDLARFQAFPETEMTMTPQGLKVTTYTAQAGGVEQCVDITGRITSVSSTVVLPELNDRGEPNGGVAALAVFLFEAAGCNGPTPDPIPAQPVIRADTPRNTPIQLRAEIATSMNTIRSAGLAFITAADDPTRPFTLTIGNLAFNIDNAAGPDLMPVVEVEGVAMYGGGVLRFPGGFPIIREGDTLKVKVRVYNIGGQPTAGEWTLSMDLNSFDWEVSTWYSGCGLGAAPYRSNAQIAPSGYVEFCIYLRARRKMEAAPINAVTFGGGDINGANNRSNTASVYVGGARDALPLIPPGVMLLDHRF